VVAKTSLKSDNGTVSKSVQEENKDANKASSVKQTPKRTRVSQSDRPSSTIDEALRVPRAIIDNYASKPTRPLDVAAALDLQPTSGTFRALAGAAIAYGLTEGGPNAPLISVKQLARRILAPSAEGEDIQARREALLMPRVPREFLTKYNGNKLPRDEIAKNVLLSIVL